MKFDLDTAPNNYTSCFYFKRPKIQGMWKMYLKFYDDVTDLNGMKRIWKLQ